MSIRFTARKDCKERLGIQTVISSLRTDSVALDDQLSLGRECQTPGRWTARAL
jgi:hypothetical protein